MSPRRHLFRIADLAQQLVGGFLLAGPFVVTEEVWTLAKHMGPVQTLLTIGIVAAIGYATLYKADRNRDPEAEADVAGVPIRFVSLLLVAFGSVTILAFVFAAPETFEAGPAATVTAISLSAIFSVIGAATADTLF